MTRAQSMSMEYEQIFVLAILAILGLPGVLFLIGACVYLTVGVVKMFRDLIEGL